MKQNSKAAATAAPVRRGAQNKGKLLKRVPRPYRTAVSHCAAQNPAARDLAASFPALLFACAVSHAGIDRKRLQAKAIEGASLAELAALAKVPMWARRLPPQAFAKPIGRLPASAAAVREMPNLLPKKPGNWQRWLAFISLATTCGDDDFALWLARVYKDIPDYFVENDIRRLALWAWFSQRPETVAGRLVLRKWTSAISWNTADKAVDCWTESLTLFIVLGKKELVYARETEREADGFHFETLTSAQAVFEQARVFKNCIRTYAHCLRDRRRRLIAVRRNGKTVALLCVSEGSGQRRFSVEELRAERNGVVEDATAEAVRRWQLKQDPHILTSDMGPFDGRLCQKSWRDFWKPYWREKGRQPLVPFHVDKNSLNKLRW